MARLIDLDEILIVRHLQTDRPGETFDGAVLNILIAFPSALRVAVLVPDHIRLLKNVRARLRLHRLVRRSPKRCPNLHGGNFAIAGLSRIRLSHYLVFLGETRIENSAEIHVAGVPAGAQDHARSGLDV